MKILYIARCNKDLLLGSVPGRRSIVDWSQFFI